MKQTAQQITMDTLKGDCVVLNLMDLINEQEGMLREVKEKLKKDFDAVDEKFFKKYEEKTKELKVLAQGWIERAYPNDKGYQYLGNYEVKIVVYNKT